MFTCQINSGLELRLFEEHHADELFAAVDANRAHLRRFLPWVDASASAEDSRQFIRRGLEQFARHDGFQAGIWFDGRIVGAIGVHYIRWKSRKTEIGYWLAESAQGSGIMTRACRALIDYAFGELKLNRVEIRCAPDNRRSRAVPERLGFTHEATLRQAMDLHGELVDDVVYGLLRDDWLARGR